MVSCLDDKGLGPPPGPLATRGAQAAGGPRAPSRQPLEEVARPPPRGLGTSPLNPLWDPSRTSKEGTDWRGWTGECPGPAETCSHRTPPSLRFETRRRQLYRDTASTPLTCPIWGSTVHAPCGRKGGIEKTSKANNEKAMLRLRTPATPLITCSEFAPNCHKAGQASHVIQTSENADHPSLRRIPPSFKGGGGMH